MLLQFFIYKSAFRSSSNLFINIPLGIGQPCYWVFNIFKTMEVNSHFSSVKGFL